jgi:hypothetical protein
VKRANIRAKKNHLSHLFSSMIALTVLKKTLPKHRFDNHSCSLHAMHITEDAFVLGSNLHPLSSSD